MFRKHLTIALLCCLTYSAIAQTISGIITDYNGFWKSGVGYLNSAKPNNSNNLLAFTYNGVQYSTGVNDNVLTSNSETFSPQIYHSLPITSIQGTPNSTTKIALGQLYDGVDNGASSPAPQNNIPLYLDDGINGLNLGTGVANLPAGNQKFQVSILDPALIGDGIPDLLITQIADPAGAVDRYYFSGQNSQLLGTSRDISLVGLNPLGTWTADFYEASANMALTSGFTKTDRQIRFFAAELSYFGITAQNYTDVTHFNIRLSGTSDQAFIGVYNTKAIGNVQQVAAPPLPVIFENLEAFIETGKLKVNWSTLSETNNNYFEIQGSKDGSNFQKLATVKSKTLAHNASAKNEYQWSLDLNDATSGVLSASLFLLFITGQIRQRKKYRLILCLFTCIAGCAFLTSCTKDITTVKDQNKKMFIRIKQVDVDGTESYSKTVLAVYK